MTDRWHLRHVLLAAIAGAAALVVLSIVGGAIAFVAGRWCAQLLGWF